MFGLGTTEILVLLACPVFIGALVVALVLLMNRGSGEQPNPNLVPCPDCGTGVSRAAVSCPRCGRPLQPMA